MKKVYYWSPFLSNIATSKAVFNSALSLKKFSKNEYKPYLINVIGEWNLYKNEIEKNNIGLIDLGIARNFKVKKINGFLLSRFFYIKIFLLAFSPLKELLRKKPPDILILHLITSLPLLLNLIFNFNTSIVLRISGLPKLNIIRMSLWKMCLKKISCITSPTKATLDFIKSLKLNRDNFLLRDPIIHVNEILQKKKKVGEYKDKIKKNYVAIGRLTKQKNFAFLIKCFEKIINKDNKIKLYILGDGEDKKKLQNLIIRNKLNNNIFIEGYQNNIYKYLKRADAFILSSLWEDPGFVLVEAFYSNTIVISSNCKNGPAEILENEKNGFLFENNSENSFFQKFDEFKNTSEKDIKIIKLQAKKMSKNYSLFNHYENLIKIINFK
jgi:glycosyltransferase involved in cell wall biosynthesis